MPASPGSSDRRDNGRLLLYAPAASSVPAAGWAACGSSDVNRPAVPSARGLRRARSLA